MQITQHTSTVLKLEAKQDLSGLAIALFAGFIPFSIGLLVVLILGRLTTLSCERLEPKQVTCESISSSLLGKNVRAIGQIQGAEVQASSDGDTFRVVLIARDGKKPLTGAYTSGAWGKQKKVEQINAFINNPDAPSLQIQQDDRPLAYLIGSPFAIFGVGALFFALLSKSLVLCLFDKTSGQMYLKHQNFLLLSETREESLSAIARAEVEEDTDSDGDKIYRAKLVFQSGESISLDPLSDRAETVQTINQFLGINE